MILPGRRTAHGQPGDICFVFLGSKAKNTLKLLKIHRANHFITDGGLYLHGFWDFRYKVSFELGKKSPGRTALF